MRTAMWVIRTASDVASPLTFRLLPGSTRTVGRATGADFVVDANLVSRVHCRLTAGTAELEVLDLGSTNGTYVNGHRVTRAALKSGDTLSVGEVQFIVLDERTQSFAGSTILA